MSLLHVATLGVALLGPADRASGSRFGRGGRVGRRNRSWHTWAADCFRLRRPSGPGSHVSCTTGSASSWQSSPSSWTRCRAVSLTSDATHKADAAMLAQRTRAIAADVQQVTRGLHPARLEHLGLVPAVRAMGHEMEHSGAPDRCLRVGLACPAAQRGRALSLSGGSGGAAQRGQAQRGRSVVGVVPAPGNAPSPSRSPTLGLGFDPQAAEAHGGLGIREHAAAVTGHRRITDDHRGAGTGHPCTGSTSPPGAAPATRRAPWRRAEDAVLIPRSSDTL